MAAVENDTTEVVDSAIRTWNQHYTASPVTASVGTLPQWIDIHRTTPTSGDTLNENLGALPHRIDIYCPDPAKTFESAVNEETLPLRIETHHPDPTTMVDLGRPESAYAQLPLSIDENFPSRSARVQVSPGSSVIALSALPPL